MSVESTREVMMQYWEHDDLSILDEDAIFTVMGTGKQARGRGQSGRHGCADWCHGDRKNGARR